MVLVVHGFRMAQVVQMVPEVELSPRSQGGPAREDLNSPGVLTLSNRASGCIFLRPERLVLYVENHVIIYYPAPLKMYELRIPVLPQLSA
jgi:hypothetical protein